jgi:PEGA domain
MVRGEHSSPAPHAIADLGAPEKPAVAQKPAAAEKPAASAKPTPPPKSAAVEAPAAPEKDEADDAPAAPKLAAAEKRAPAERPSAAPAAAPEVISGERGACMARVITEPKDAKVIWAGTEIGRSPIDTAKVPCGPAKVTVERERWQPVTVDVTLQDGDTAVVRQRLHRPRGLLVISSSPPGAQITVNRVAAGAAPKQVDIQRFEKVPIKITLKGYKPWSKTIYLKEAEAKIDAQLVAR